MDKRKRRFRRGEHQEEELRLDDVLEPYDQDEPADDEQSGQTFAPYEDEAGPLYEQQPTPAWSSWRCVPRSKRREPLRRNGPFSTNSKWRNPNRSMAFCSCQQIFSVTAIIT